VLFRADGKVFRVEAGTGAPLREPHRIARLFEDRLDVIGDEVDPGFGFDIVRLAALVTERSDPQQTGLAAPDHEAELAHLIDRLGARVGLRRVMRQVPQDTHIPEFAVTAVAAAALQRTSPAHARPLTGINCSGHPAPRTGSPLSRGRAEVLQYDSPFPTRPIRLFARPEPVDAMAELPDGPPAQFTWRRMRHVVVRAEGPERIAMEWWRDEQGRALMRDYFRVESREGVRVWLFREGLFGRETAQPRWFVHGLFT
jgi:protein ImuB